MVIELIGLPLIVILCAVLLVLLCCVCHCCTKRFQTKKRKSYRSDCDIEKALLGDAKHRSLTLLPSVGGIVVVSGLTSDEKPGKFYDPQMRTTWERSSSLGNIIIAPMHHFTTNGLTCDCERNGKNDIVHMCEKSKQAAKMESMLLPQKVTGKEGMFPVSAPNPGPTPGTFFYPTPNCDCQECFNCTRTGAFRTSFGTVLPPPPPPYYQNSDYDFTEVHRTSK